MYDTLPLPLKLAVAVIVLLGPCVLFAFMLVVVVDELLVVGCCNLPPLQL